MVHPVNSIYIIQGEVNLLVTAMRRNSRWSGHYHQDEEQDSLLVGLSQLKTLLGSLTDLEEISLIEFLTPFLEIIRSEDTSGPITGLALNSINKFLSYGLIDPSAKPVQQAVELIADAVTHARFVGTDPSSDEVVLMKILHVLHALFLTPAGSLLSNESVCEIMQSCFRICFETRLSELLRKSAEHTLVDMVQLLFSRLPQFKEDPKWASSIKKLKMWPGGIEQSRTSRVRNKKGTGRGKKVTATDGSVRKSGGEGGEDRREGSSGKRTDMPDNKDAAGKKESGGSADARECTVDGSASDSGLGSYVTVDSCQDIVELAARASETNVLFNSPSVDSLPAFTADHTVKPPVTLPLVTTPVTQLSGLVDLHSSLKGEGEDSCLDTPSMEVCNVTIESTDDISVAHGANEQQVASEFVNAQGIKFTAVEPEQPDASSDKGAPPVPYGLPCVRELFRFLISLINPNDRHNSDSMIHLGLSLLTVAMETSADSVAPFTALISLVKDDLCRNLFFLLQSERLSLFAASLRLCFLIFESMRGHLKYQLEMYVTRLMDCVSTESVRVVHEQRELALESLIQLLQVPGLVTELFINYDCDVQCANVFEELTKMLSKNAFPVSGLTSTHLLSLDALIVVIDSIEQNCHYRMTQAIKSSADTVDGKKATDDTRPPAVPDIISQSAVDFQSHDQSNQSKSGLKDQPMDLQVAFKPRANRMQANEGLPLDTALARCRQVKKWYQAGTEQFNQKPAKGVALLQEHGLLSDLGEVVTFIRENHRLDKAKIGDYISDKKNKHILEAFQKSFNFEDARIDEALRMYLETFRLPGEAPVIAHLFEHFADHWHKMNGEPFVNVDAAFTLAYAVIMLNTDQHNNNAKKQNVPMTCEDFKKNVAKCNGGQDFDQDMLEEIYHSIKGEEIVMPSEQTGVVRELYLWKTLIRRGQTASPYLHTPTGAYDSELFSIVWGPAAAALSFIFDKSSDETVIHKAVSGFRKCALIAAHYSMCEVFDNLVISLCKFTTLLNPLEQVDTIPVHLGLNAKAQLATKTVFGLAHRHGDILREGWKNILDIMLQLYRAKLLPEILVKVEDFLSPTGSISLVKEDTTASHQHRTETGVFSSFYSLFVATDSGQQREPVAEEQAAISSAQKCIEECHVEQLVTDSKFLPVESLHELVKALIMMSRSPDPSDADIGNTHDEDSAVFFLELLIKVILQNRDRVSPFWASVQSHVYAIVVNATEPTLLVERAVVGLLRLAMRLLRREEVASQVMTSLQILLLMQPTVIHALCRHVSFALNDLLKTNAANIHSSRDWYTLFTLLEVVGAGANPPPLMHSTAGVNVPDSLHDAGAQSDSEVTGGPTVTGRQETDRGYTSDGEVHDVARAAAKTQQQQREEAKLAPSNGSWQMVNKEEVEALIQRLPLVNASQISVGEGVGQHDTRSLMKCCETLSFLVRDAAHVTPHNFESCVHCIRVFVEASLNGGQKRKAAAKPGQGQGQQASGRRGKRGGAKADDKVKKSKSTPLELAQSADEDEDRQRDAYNSLSVQLLDLMHTFHTRAAAIFNSWAAEEPRMACENLPDMVDSVVDAQPSTLWTKCWCPLLQGIARLCCDSRRQVRSQAITYLQRSLLVHDLQILSPIEWESCFTKVILPMMSLLLTNIAAQDPHGLEETRMRASTLLCKVFLQHLTQLLQLSTFNALWLTILDFMDKYMHADRSDTLLEAIPELLKNMLLVMHTAGILTTGQEETTRWKLTWHRIDAFLPHLRDELYKPHTPDVKRQAEGSHPLDAGSSRAMCSSPTQETSPTASPRPTSPAGQEVAASPPRSRGDAPPLSSSPPPAAPLLAAPLTMAGTESYVLHPPLPPLASGVSIVKQPTTSSVPLLLNPAVIHGALNTPQNVPGVSSSSELTSLTGDR